MDNWTGEEVEFLETLMGRPELNWEDIREIMTDSGYPDRGPRAYASKAYRMNLTMEEVEEGEADLDSYLIYKFLRDAPRTLAQLCDKFEKPPKYIRQKINDMEDEGYNVIQTKGKNVIPTQSFPNVEIPQVSVADMAQRQVLNIGLISDLHAGSKNSQPTAFNRFIQYAGEEYDVRHFFYMGDSTDGLYGYRGHMAELIPSARPISRKLAHLATRRQVWLANKYFPRIDGVTYHILGGNHDWWHVVNTGIDAVRELTKDRDDMIYCGYDMAAIPLTDKTYMRMWHPTGGVAYAKSYKVQKGIEATGIEALNEAIRKEESPLVSILVAGHWHIASWVPSSPIYGGSLGAFQAQTDYLKRKQLMPDVGGCIMRLVFGDDGRIQHIGYDWVPSLVRDKDWESWPTPEIEELSFDADDLDTVFELDQSKEPA